MIKKISLILFWVGFFGFFLYKLIPTFMYITNDTLEHWGNKSFLDNTIFTLHIVAGIIVYFTAVLQFTPTIRNKYMSLHRITGKVYIISSLICIVSLYIIISRTLCIPCRPSQLIVTTLWLLFLLLAYYFIRQRKIVMHKRMMICSFICAAYFVSIRIIDAFAMNIFYYFFPNDSNAFLASDVFVWLVPLSFLSIFWWLKDRKYLKGL